MEQGKYQCPECGTPLTQFGKFWMCPEHGPQDPTASAQSATPSTTQSQVPHEDIKHDLFISYAHADNESGWIDDFVTSLKAEYKKLSDLDLHVFFDKESIKNGDDWQHRIASNVASSTQFVIFMSPNYFKSEWCRREWRKWIDTEIANHLLNQGVAPIQIVPVRGLFDGAMQPGEVAYHLAGQVDTDNRLQLESAISRHIHEIQKRHHEQDKYTLEQDYQQIIKTAESEMLQRKLQELAAQVYSRKQVMLNAAQSDSTVWRYNRNFTGRLDELMQLNSMLTDNDAGVITCIRGLGGLGKTELANTYAHAYAHQYLGGRFRIACEGHTDLREAIVNQASEHAGRYIFEGISDTNQNDIKTCFALICHNIQRRLSEQGRLLLILDNVTDESLMDTDDLSELTALGGNLHILATSRESVLEDTDNELVLGPLETHDSIELLRKFRYFEDGSEAADAAHQICNKLAGFTLALELLGAYVATRPKAITYAHHLKDSDLSGLEDIADNKKGKLNRHNRERQLSAIMAPLYDALASNEQLLCVAQYASLLPPDTIPVSWIKQLLVEKFPALDQESRGYDFWIDLYDELQQASILTADGEYTSAVKTVRMHRLLQDWFKDQMSDEELQDKTKALTQLMNQRVLTLLNTPNWQADQWEHLVILDVIDSIISPDNLSDDDLNRLRMLSSQLDRFGKLLQAIALGEYVHTLLSERLEDHPHNQSLKAYIVTSYNHLGLLYGYRGQPKKSFEYLQASLELQQEMLEDNPGDESSKRNLATSYANLTDLFEDFGDTAQAFTYGQTALRLREELLQDNPNHTKNQQDVASSHSLIASLYSHSGNTEASIASHQLALQLRTALVDNHPDNDSFKEDLASSCNNIGYEYENIGHIEEALANYQNSLRLYQELLEANPQDELRTRNIAIAHNNIAMICKDMGQTEVALEHQQIALQIRTDLLENNPDSESVKEDLASSHNNMGTLYANMGQEEAGLVHLEKSLQLQQELVDHNPDNESNKEDLASTHNNVGYLYYKLSDDEQALAHYQTALQISQEQVAKNPDHEAMKQSLAYAHSHIADLYDDLDKDEEALKHFLVALEVRQGLVESNPVNDFLKDELATTHNNLGYYYAKIGSTNEASSQYHSSIALYKALLEKSPLNETYKENIASAYSNMGDLYEITENPQRALESYLLELQIRLDLSGNKPTEDYAEQLANNHRRIGNIYYLNGQYQEALKHYSAELPLRQEVYEMNPDDESQTNLATTNQFTAYAYERLDSVDDAESYYQEALQLYGAMDPSESVMKSMATIHGNIGYNHKCINNLDKAIVHYNEAKQINQQLTAHNPDDPDYADDLSLSLFNLGKLYQQTGQTQAALEHCMEDHRLCKTLYSENSETIAYEFSYVVTLGRLARVSILAGNLSDVFTLAEGASAWMDELCIDNPENASYARNRAICYGVLAQAYIASGDSQKALEYLLKDLDVCETFDLGEVRAISTLGTSHYNLGKYYIALDKPKEAQAHLGEAMQLFDAVYQKTKREKYAMLCEAVKGMVE